jgi:hypothetical protein
MMCDACLASRAIGSLPSTRLSNSLEESSRGAKDRESDGDRGSMVPAVEGKSRRQVVEQDPLKRNKDAAASVYKKMSRLGRVLRTKKEKSRHLTTSTKRSCLIDLTKAAE